MSKEVMKLALEAFETGTYAAESAAITALREELEKPDQKPVRREQRMFMEEQELYTAPQPAQPLIPASLAERQFERYYRQGYDAGLKAAQRQRLTDEQCISIVECALNGHASSRSAMLWAIKHTERLHGIGAKP